MSTGNIKAICMSEKKGTIKRPVAEALFITEHGIKGDAHAGSWHRQVSFLALEEIEDFRRRVVRWNSETLGKISWQRALPSTSCPWARG
ncbi:hypothetical protein [Selenomonas sp. AB3002]|uniref:hypothetical protein n=1 Tax=Selenomonas sp. AB3002 TaxID=1392502 RepID=UPI000AD2630B